MSAAFENPIYRSHERQRVDAREVDLLALVATGSRRAFTLIELLVVIGLIALVAGGIGFALGDSGGNSLASAQNTLTSLTGAVRAQAAMNQTEARLLIHGTRPPADTTGNYLRLLRIVIAETPGSASTRWISVGSPIALPRGVYVVPASTTGLLAAGVIWPAGGNAPVSNLLVTPARLTIVNDQPGSETWFSIEFRPDGTPNLPTNVTNGKLVLSTATVANSLPQFNNPGAARGVLIRSSGSLSAVSDANGF